MILMYHKVDQITPSKWWVSVSRFREQIEMVTEKFEVVYLSDYEPNDPKKAVITFDDAYENVFNHAFPVLKAHQLPFEVFVIGNLVGDWNTYDKNEMKTRFCGIHHLQEMAASGARIQWHSANHLNLASLDEAGIKEETQVSDKLKKKFPSPHFDWFSYPYGIYDERIIRYVKERFQGAVAVDDGDERDVYTLTRTTVVETWMP